MFENIITYLCAEKLINIEKPSVLLKILMLRNQYEVISSFCQELKLPKWNLVLNPFSDQCLIIDEVLIRQTVPHSSMIQELQGKLVHLFNYMSKSQSEKLTFWFVNSF